MQIVDGVTCCCGTCCWWDTAPGATMGRCTIPATPATVNCGVQPADALCEQWTERDGERRPYDGKDNSRDQ